MKDEAERDKYYENVHLEIKFEVDDVRKNDEVHYLVFQFICNFDNLAFHGLGEEDEGENAVEKNCQTKNHVVKNKDATLVSQECHHSFEVGIGVKKMVIDRVEEDC